MSAPRNQRATPEETCYVTRLPPVLAPDCSPFDNPLSVDYIEPGTPLTQVFRQSARHRFAESALSEGEGDVYARSDDEGLDPSADW